MGVEENTKMIAFLSLEDLSMARKESDLKGRKKKSDITGRKIE